MDILVLDIGCTYIKGIVVRAGKVIDEIVGRTPSTASGILEGSRFIVDDVLRLGYEIEAIMPISFSESIMVEYRKGVIELQGPVEPEVPKSVYRPAYELTGYPTDTFPGVCKRMQVLKDADDGWNMGIFRILPVSAMVAVFLAGNTHWKMWDWTHASNSGLYGRGEWLASVQEEYEKKDWFYTRHVCSPKTIVGKCSSTIYVCIGGHDQLFAISDKPRAYVSCGTYITASQPSDFLHHESLELRRPNYEQDVRYVQGVSGMYQRQLCMKGTGEIDSMQLVEIRQFLSTDEVLVFGSYSQQMAERLEDYSFIPEAIEHQQFIGAALAAETAVIQNADTNTAAA